MKEPHILYQTEENIAIIIINRPEAKNAFSPEMITLWREALERCQGRSKRPGDCCDRKG